MMFNTPTALQTIYGDSRSNNVRKADVYTYFNDGKEKPSTITTLDKGPQGRKRRILSHAFSEPARRQSDQFIIENVDRWLDLLGQTDGQQDHGWGGAKDMTQYCDWLAFDIAMHLAFGKSYKLVENPELRFLPMYIMAGFRGLCTVSQANSSLNRLFLRI
jgi:cytochrome P450